MRYLKPFNEAVTQDNIELCCVDLFDDGFELKDYNDITKKAFDRTNVISLQKVIVSDMQEWDNLPAALYHRKSLLCKQGTDVRGDIMWDEHLSKYQPGTIIISGDNFDKVDTSFRQKLLSENEKELVSKVSDITSLLSHYSGTTKGKGAEIEITSGPYQNPMNFQYERYRTIINIFIYL